MDVLPLVPVGLLVIVVSWLIWPVFHDAFLRTAAQGDDTEFDYEDMEDILFGAWSARGEQSGDAFDQRAA